MPQAATQEFLEINQIREGVIVLKNKALRGILMVSSLNFALKSDEEQIAITYQFQNFLNSLDFTCQIITQSRKLNITGYLEKLKNLEKKQKNELLQIQTTGYREFIQGLVKKSTIMTKSFFITIPFTLMEAKGLTFSKIPKAYQPSVLTENDFQRCKSQLWQRIEFLAIGLRRCGLQATPLNTPELIELFWGLYHPSEAEIGYYPEIPPELTMQ